MVKIFVSAILVVVILALVIILSPVFKIKRIEISQQDCIESQKPLEKYKVIGVNIFLFKSGQLAQSIKNDFICVEQVKVEKKYPSSLVVMVQSQEVVAKIEGKNLVVTADARVIAQDATSDLPMLTLGADSNIEAGGKITDKTIVFAIEATSLVKKTDFAAQNIRIVDGDVVVYGTGGIMVIFSPEKEVYFQVDSLQQVIAEAKIDAAKIAKIDLRFDNPIVVNK